MINNVNKMIIDSRFAHREIKPDLQDAAETRWLEKKVLRSIPLHPCKSLENVQLKGFGTIELSSERYHTPGDCLLVTTNTDVDGLVPRPKTTAVFSMNKADWSQFNRVSAWVYPEAVGYQNFYVHFSIFNENTRGENHAPSLTPNEWNHVTWEISHLSRNSVISLNITPFLMGCPPEGTPLLKMFIDDIRLETVEPDHELGWELDDRIAYCHSGYFPKSQKMAVTQKAMAQAFYIYNEQQELVFTGTVKPVQNDLGTFATMDFTALEKPGKYFLKIDDRKTPLFSIDSNPYASAIWKSMNFLRMLRCGEDVPEVHSPCHLHHYCRHQDGRMVPTFGGWHDAGDVSQFEICTAEMAQAILELSETVKSKDQALYERLLEEAKVGINWLLRTRFADGYRALAVLYSIWRKNETKPDTFSPENPIYKTNVAENGPFENFLAASAEAVAARVFKEEDRVFADWCRRCAMEDFRFGAEGYKQGLYTKRWGKGPEPQVCGAGAIAAAELFILTGDEEYLRFGDDYASIILSCQQKDYPAWEKPLRGFFYEDPEHTKLLTYEHRGHEQTPVQGLIRLLNVAPLHPHASRWMEGVRLYAEYILKTKDVSAPYDLLPAHVYEAEKLNMTRFTIPEEYGTTEEGFTTFQRQIKQGIRLSETAYLRRFPIAIQRRGFHATLLSKTKAVSMMARILKSEELKQTAINQLEWILGKNPFASSTMYGEGHNFHPLYVAFSRQLVGALPVGIETLGDADVPYWPVINHSVYKEIWGHTTGKFLWVLADLLRE